MLYDLFVVEAEQHIFEKKEGGRSRIVRQILPTFFVPSDMGESGALASVKEILLVDDVPSTECLAGYTIDCCPRHRWIVQLSPVGVTVLK